ncbi:MAG: low specificity L-threonine aldolase [Thermoleophilia bacterium]
MKHLFLDDYSEGAHPRILKALEETNWSQEPGYGDDGFCRQAAEMIKAKIENPSASVHFVSGGTQANIIVLASLLKPYESVIAPQTAHIAIHEAGAIELTGHKVNVVASKNGKITPEQVTAICDEHTGGHTVLPKAVFVSNSTEMGTIYKKSELEGLAEICQQKHLFLYLDGARLGSALTSIESDLSLADLSRLVDVFYIGATKNGALLGEAVVITRPELQPDFRYHIKQRGGLLAKGRLLGIQFVELFRDNLYFNLARHANEMACRLVQGITALGYSFLTPSTTNQIFPILPESTITKLQQIYGFYVWEKMDREDTAIRLVTSWATKDEAVDAFLNDLRTFRGAA